MEVRWGRGERAHVFRAYPFPAPPCTVGGPPHSQHTGGGHFGATHGGQLAGSSGCSYGFGCGGGSYGSYGAGSYGSLPSSSSAGSLHGSNSGGKAAGQHHHGSGHHGGHGSHGSQSSSHGSFGSGHHGSGHHGSHHWNGHGNGHHGISQHGSAHFGSGHFGSHGLKGNYGSHTVTEVKADQAISFEGIFRFEVRNLHVQYAEQIIKDDSIFILSSFYGHRNLEYEHVFV